MSSLIRCSDEFSIATTSASSITTSISIDQEIISLRKASEPTIEIPPITEKSKKNKKIEHYRQVNLLDNNCVRENKRCKKTVEDEKLRQNQHNSHVQIEQAYQNKEHWDNDQHRFEECQTVFLPIMLKMKDATATKNEHIAEQSMKEMEDNATMITAPFIDHYHPEEILKVLTRTMMAINKKFMLLGKKILKKLEKAYFHDRSLVSEGFKPIAIPTILGATKHSAIVPDVISRNNDDLKNRPIYVVSEQTIFEKNKNVEESGSDIECTLSSTPRPFNKLFRIVEEREAFFGAKKSISRYSLMKRISNIEEFVFGQTGNILCTVSLISRLDALTYFDTSKNRKLWVDVIAEMEDALDVVAPAGCHACERVERLERVIWGDVISKNKKMNHCLFVRVQALVDVEF